MNSQLTTRILNNIPEFSKGQKLIVRCMLEYYDKVAHIAALRLGATVGVGRSTVVRSAAEIEYSGYPKLQQAMQEMIRNRLTSVQRIEITVNNMGSSDVLSSAMNQNIDIIRRIPEEISRKDFYATVDVIADSRKIYALGAGSSLALATFLSYYSGLTLENIQLVNITSEAEALERMIRVNEADTVIGISFPRYSKRAVRAIHFASDRGTKVIAITDSPLSLLAEPAGYLLLARSNMAFFADAIATSPSLVNALIVMVTMRKKEEVTGILHSLGHIWDEYGVYGKVDEKNVDTDKPQG